MVKSSNVRLSVDFFLLLIPIHHNYFLLVNVSNNEEETKNTDKTEPLVLQETDITDIPDENKGTEVQETA